MLESQQRRLGAGGDEFQEGGFFFGGEVPFEDVRFIIMLRRVDEDTQAVDAVLNSALPAAVPVRPSRMNSSRGLPNTIDATIRADRPKM